MAFQAKINLAKSYDVNSGDRLQITKILTKMLKDDKNVDYKDQIYYALADVALRDHDTAAAVNYFRLSVSSSVKNNYQRATSALTLADIYFAKPEYENAQAYYDTAMMSIPKDYPNYAEIEKKTKVLTDLVVNLITIQQEDSLQRIVNMSETDRNAVIEKLIKAYYEEQQRLAEQKKLEEQLTIQEQAVSGAGQGNQGLPVGGKWYFYNQQTKDYGFAEFVKKWGRRKLEDLWNISDKQTVSFGNEQAETLADSTANDSVVEAAKNPMNREYYLKNLPFSDSALEISNNKILEAYFKAATVYKDGLNDLEESGETFITMNERFPDNEHELLSYYYLFKINTELKQTDRAAYYKNLIITQYPESDYARVLADPEYYTKISAEKNKVNVLYEDTYKDFKAGQFFQVIANSNQAFSLYGDTMELAPKFAYLKAISIGKIDVIDSLVAQLKMIISKYPHSEVKILSQNILASIIKENPELKDESIVLPEEEVPGEAPSPYKFNPSAQHMFMIVADSKEIRLNPFKVKLSDYNLKYYSLDGLNINSLVLDNQHYLITIGNFNNSTKAKDYFDAITASDYVFADLKQGSFYNFVISTENYPIFFKEKDVGGYSKFFEKNYSK